MRFIKSLQKTYKTLLVKQLNSSIQIVSLNRRENRNAINSVMINDLFKYWQSIETSKIKPRCIIITGSGDEAFSMGVDFKERQHMSLETWKEHHKILHQSMIAMMKCSSVIIAAANGNANGAGLELALASDMIYASDHSQFSLSDINYSLMPGAMGTVNLPIAIGLNRAKEYALSGQQMDATKAYEIGLVNRVFKSNLLLRKTIEFAEVICQKDPDVVAHIKQSLNSYHSKTSHDQKCATEQLHYYDILNRELFRNDFKDLSCPESQICHDDNSPPSSMKRTS